MDKVKMNREITNFIIKKLDTSDFAVIQEDIESAKGNTEIVSENLLLGVVKSQIQPALDNNKGEIPGDLVMGLISLYYNLTMVFHIKKLFMRLMQQ
jgi:hypothetical protein